MVRRDREDEPGCILHIFNRGLARRMVFECLDDVRYFLSRLAREHRRGRLRIHAFVVLSNHFHLVVESPLGQASEAMRVIQNEYVRHFNRRRMRDGPLFRGRFGSRRVRSESYWWTLLRYIDLHPEEARIASHPGLYPFGSAAHYLTGGGPKWLTTRRVEEMLAEGTGEYSPARYERLLDRPLSDAERELVRLRMEHPRASEDPLDELMTSGPSRVREWMVRKAANADGTRPGIAVAAPSTLIELVGAERLAEPEWRVKSGRQSRDAWELVLTGLLRDACGLSVTEVARRMGIGVSSVHARVHVHRRLMVEVEEYSERAAATLTGTFGDFVVPETGRVSKLLP